MTVTFDFDPHPLCSGTHYSISVRHMSVELVKFMMKINAVGSERTFLFLFI